MTEGKKNQRGAALLMAMLIMVLATLLATAMLTAGDRWVQSLVVRQDRAQALEYARAATEYGRLILREDQMSNKIDHQDEDWARSDLSLSVDGAEMSGRIQDAQSRFNLNNLLLSGVFNQGAFEDLERLLAQLGLPPALAQTLADWVDKDELPRPLGAESAYYATLPLPYRAANQRLTRLDDLRQVSGFSPELIQRLRDFVVVLPTYAELNANTVPPELLMAVLPGLSGSEAGALVAQRPNHWFVDGADLRQRLRADIPSNHTPLSAQSRYFFISITTRFGGAIVNLETLVERPLMPGSLPSIIWQHEK